MKRYPLFDGVGIEIEYMIVDTASAAIRPLAPELLRAVGGGSEPVANAMVESVGWSNEFVLHLLEMKTELPERSLLAMARRFATSVATANRHLQPMGATLVGGGNHPFMNPLTETALWPYEGSEIYEAYDHIFDARQHGYANVQSVHLNYPFDSDEAFGRLHAAIRLVLPLIPAIAAASPLVEGGWSKRLDARLHAYMVNALRVPSMTGATIPEPVYTPADYEATILRPLYDDIRSLDVKGVLDAGEWLNARGAIARFDRSAIEVRLVDTQEAPIMDMGVAALVTGLLKAMVEERWVSYETQKAFDTRRLKRVLLSTVEYAETAVIVDKEYLALFDEETTMSAGALWRSVAHEAFAAFPVEEEVEEAAQFILDQGTLATRMVSYLNGDHRHERIVALLMEMARSLAEGRPFEG